MLTRIANHHVNNPNLIDKLIVIHGLPKEWIFRTSSHGDELVNPWEPDSDVNIPRHIRHLCDPITFVKYFQPVQHQAKTYEGFWDKRTVLGVKIDYGYGPGQDMWNKIEDYIDKTLPRGEKMPVPVLVAKDQKSPFETYMPRRSERGNGIELVPAEIPVIDLRVSVPELILPKPSPAIIPTVETAKVEAKSEPVEFKCNECGKTFDKERALGTHQMHHRRAKVAV